MVSAFTRMASRVSTCSILKPPAFVDGKRGEPEAYLTDVACTPIDPVSNDYELRPPLEKPVKLYMTCVEITNEVKSGYLLTQDSTQYIVRNVDRTEWRGSISQTLILEKDELNG